MTAAGLRIAAGQRHGDLADRGKLKDTVIVWMGEFGRTPRINQNGGRDHYPRAWSVVVGGGNIKGGVAYGSGNLAGAFERHKNSSQVLSAWEKFWDESTTKNTKNTKQIQRFSLWPLWALWFLKRRMCDWFTRSQVLAITSVRVFVQIAARIDRRCQAPPRSATRERATRHEETLPRPDGESRARSRRRRRSHPDADRPRG